MNYSEFLELRHSDSIDKYTPKTYLPFISCNENRKGVLDIDTVKGCSCGMAKYPSGGCYGLCYASKMARARGFDFTKSVSRLPVLENTRQLKLFSGLFLGVPEFVYNMVRSHPAMFFRIGTMGDPCHDWQLTANICDCLSRFKIPVVVTKHWITIPDILLQNFKKAGVIFNTSISALDSLDEIHNRLIQFNRLKSYGIKSVLRIVSCDFGNTKTGKSLREKQRLLFENDPVIDNPLRIPLSDERVKRGDIKAELVKDLNIKSSISIFNKKTYIGKCEKCPDQCGVTYFNDRRVTCKTK